MHDKTGLLHIDGLHTLEFTEINPLGLVHAFGIIAKYLTQKQNFNDVIIGNRNKL